MKKQIKLTDLHSDLMNQYVIVAQCFEHYSNRHIIHGDIINMTPSNNITAWVIDDRGGYGYSYKEATAVIEGYYNESDQYRWEDEESARELMQGFCEDQDIEYNGELPEWFKGAGYYSCDGNVFVAENGKVESFDEGDVWYHIELANDIDIIIFE